MAASGHDHMPQLGIKDLLTRIGVLLQTERRILWLLISYSVAIGLFSLIVPLTVQELVNTFAFAVQPMTIVTLTLIIIVGLLFVGAFRGFQIYAEETLQRRLFARVALGMTQHLSDVQVWSFRPRYANFFTEAVLMQRALSAFLIDLIDVVIGGAVGMTLLVFYHPFFLGFNVVFTGGGAAVLFLLTQGGLRATIEMSQWKYDILHWIQEISYNVLHFKSATCKPYLLKRTDELLDGYIEARRSRFSVMMRQHLGSVFWQALGQGGVIATAGWLVSTGQLTVGQLVAAQVVVGKLIYSFDSLVKKTGYFFYFLTALTELDFVFSLPKDEHRIEVPVALPDPTVQGLRIVASNVEVRHRDGSRIVGPCDVEIMPGEKISLHVPNQAAKTSLARVLAGLETPTSGVMRYNGVDLRHVEMDAINNCRGFVLDSRMSLFEGSVEDNITLGRPSIPYADLRWALRFVELEEEIDALPEGIKSSVRAPGAVFSNSRILRMLLARAIITRPQVVILDGLLHPLPPIHRETILRRLCSKDEPWSVIFVTTDPAMTPYVDRQIVCEA
ncbi:MAG: ATP-binding cassette domain-containing protein [Nitrospiraceae bacterium]